VKADKPICAVRNRRAVSRRKD